MKSKSRNENSISFWRVIFTLVILLFHFTDGFTAIYQEYPFIQYHWYIAVEFFFIVSGFLMMKHAENHSEESTWKYTGGRIKRLFPEYIVILVLTVIIRMIIAGEKPFKAILGHWEEFLMLQSLGTNKFPYLNNPAWYVSALIICGHILYYLIRNHKKIYIELVAPLLVITILSYFYRNCGSISSFFTTDNYWLNTGVMRGLMGMAMGSLIYVGFAALKPKLNTLLRILFLIVEVCSFAFVIFFSMTHGDTKYDYLFFAVMAIGVFGASCNDRFIKLQNTKFWSFLDELSYTVFLIHYPVVMCLSRIWDNSQWHWWWMGVYVIIVLIVAIIIHFSTNLVLKKIRKQGEKRIDGGKQSESV